MLKKNRAIGLTNMINNFETYRHTQKLRIEFEGEFSTEGSDHSLMVEHNLSSTCDIF